MNQQNFSKRIAAMAQTKWILAPAMLLLSFLSAIPAKAGNTHTVNMTVGETATLTFSTSQTVKPGSMQWWSNRSSNVQVISYSGTKATVKALSSFSGYAIVRCDYSYFILNGQYMYEKIDYEDFYVYVSGSSLTVSPASLNFIPSGESKSISVTSGTGWSVTKSDSWLTVSPASGSNNGTVSVTAAANTGSARNGTVTITGSGVSEEVYISQAAAPAVTLTVSPASLSFASSGESENITVTSNTGWSVTKSDSWLTVSPASGSNNGTVSVTAAANTGSARSGTVTITGGNITRTVSVSQDATPITLTVSPASLSFTSSGESKSISVTSNTGWSITKSDSWLTVSPASGSNNSTVSVTAAANTETNRRTGTVTITGGSITQTVSITQAAYVPPASTLTVSTSTLDFTASGETQSVAITSNINWTASKDAVWLTVSPASGSNNGVISVTAAANTTTNRRTATVTVSGGSLTCTVTVMQEATQQQVVVEPEQPEGGRGVIDVRLQLPVNEKFTVEFIFHLPVGFHLDEKATSLIAELLADYELLITPDGANSWRFVIRPKTAVAPRAASDMTYRQLLHIVYTMDETVGNGNYEMSLNDIDLTLNSGQTVHQDEINISVRIDGVGNNVVGATDVRYFNSRLYVNTPPAERIAVYSLDGRMIYQAQKQPGAATFNLYSLPRGVLIVRGDSGWVKKIIR